MDEPKPEGRSITARSPYMIHSRFFPLTRNSFLLAFAVVVGWTLQPQKQVHAAPGTLVVMLEAPPKTLEPFLATDAAGVRISHQLIYETLVTLDDNLEIAPGVASSWKRLGPTRYQFTLRKNVRFHNSQSLTAEDVVFSLNHLMDPKQGSPYGPVLRDKIAAVKSIGKDTVEVKLKAPYAGILSDLILPIAPRNTKKGQLSGSGPFRFVRQTATEILLSRNEDYHGEKAGVAQVVFKVIRDENTRLLKLRKGTVDLAVNVVPLDKLVSFSRPPLKKKFALQEAPGLSFQYLGFNLRDDVLSKKLVRQALAHGINVPALIEHRQKGHSQQATGLFPAASPYANPKLKPLQYDPKLAGKLLDEAGYPLVDGKRLQLTYKTSTDRAAVIQARIVQADLKKIGVEVEVRSYEWGTFYEDIVKGNFQMFSLRWIGVNDPDFLFELFHSNRIPPDGRNRGHYKNPKMDKLLEQGRLEANPAKRKTIYQKVHDILYAELPYLPLWHSNNVAIVGRNVKGFQIHPTGGFQHLWRAQKTGR